MIKRVDIEEAPRERRYTCLRGATPLACGLNARGEASLWYDDPEGEEITHFDIRTVWTGERKPGHPFVYVGFVANPATGLVTHVFWREAV